MQLFTANKPQGVNATHFSTEQFPQIIGFCDRDPGSYVRSGAEESYFYKLHKQLVYVLKKKNARWEIIEFDHDQTIRAGAGEHLGAVLTHALTFSEKDRNRQDSRANILFPVNPPDRDKALAIMYYLGGYPTGQLALNAECALIIEKFIEPNLVFLHYSYVPIEYIDWLRQELKQAGLIGQGKNRTIWVYKK